MVIIIGFLIIKNEKAMNKNADILNDAIYKINNLKNSVDSIEDEISDIKNMPNVFNDYVLEKMIDQEKIINSFILQFNKNNEYVIQEDISDLDLLKKTIKKYRKYIEYFCYYDKNNNLEKVEAILGLSESFKYNDQKSGVNINDVLKKSFGDIKIDLLNICDEIYKNNKYLFD